MEKFEEKTFADCRYFVGVAKICVAFKLQLISKGLGLAYRAVHVYTCLQSISSTFYNCLYYI